MKNARLSDIAAKAGVGTATVERVLNARGNVKPETAERVFIAARSLGYDRALPEPYHGLIRIEVIMMRPDTPFFARLNQAFAGLAATLHPAIRLHRTFLDERDPIAVARHIADPGFRRSGLIIAAPDDPQVGARLREVAAAGVAVVQIVSRISGIEAPFIGIDNCAAGRTAAFYMARMLGSREGTIVALCHSGAYRGHRERIGGFSDYLSEHPDPAHRFALVAFCFDDDRRSAHVLTEAFAAYPDVIGVYNAGGANAAVASVLEGRQSVLWIGHELTDETRSWLRSGLMHIVLDQAPEEQARRGLEAVLGRIGFVEVSRSEQVRFLTVTAENL